MWKESLSPRGTPSASPALNARRKKTVLLEASRATRVQNGSMAEEVIFGRDVVELADHENEKMPRLLQLLCDQLSEPRCLATKGIFRISASKQHYETLIENLAKSYQYASFDQNLIMNARPHVLGDVLKSFLRRLPQPLLPLDVLRAGPDAGPMQERLAELEPPARRESLRAVMKLLHDVAAHEDENKMSASNVATCLFGPLLHPDISLTGMEQATMGPQLNENLTTLVGDSLTAQVLLPKLLIGGQRLKNVVSETPPETGAEDMDEGQQPPFSAESEVGVSVTTSQSDENVTRTSDSTASPQPPDSPKETPPRTASPDQFAIPEGVTSLLIKEIELAEVEQPPRFSVSRVGDSTLRIKLRDVVGPGAAAVPTATGSGAFGRLVVRYRKEASDPSVWVNFDVVSKTNEGNVKVHSREKVGVPFFTPEQAAHLVSVALSSDDNDLEFDVKPPSTPSLVDPDQQDSRVPSKEPAANSSNVQVVVMKFPVNEKRLPEFSVGKLSSETVTLRVSFTDDALVVLEDADEVQAPFQAILSVKSAPNAHPFLELGLVDVQFERAKVPLSFLTHEQISAPDCSISVDKTNAPASIDIIFNF